MISLAANTFTCTQIVIFGTLQVPKMTIWLHEIVFVSEALFYETAILLLKNIDPNRIHVYAT